MKIFLIMGEHYSAPNIRRVAVADKHEADCEAARLVNIIADDLKSDLAGGFMANQDGTPEGPVATDENWQNVLLWCQTVRYREARMFIGCTWQEAVDAMTEMLPSDRAADAECDVWIEELDVAMPAAPRTVFFGAVDSYNGTVLVRGDTLDDLIRCAISPNGGDWDEFVAFRETYVEGQGGEWDSGDVVVEYMRPRDSQFSWTYEEYDVPVLPPEAPTGAPVEIAVILDGGLVQHVVYRGASQPDVYVVDYDVEGADDDRLTDIAQDDGSATSASVSTPNVGPAHGDAFWTSVEAAFDAEGE